MNVRNSVRLARLEEKVKALAMQVETRDTENARRLGELNGEHRRIAEVVGSTQSKEQARADVDKVFAKIDANHEATELRITALERTGNVNKGEAWLPKIVWAAAAAGVGAYLASKLLH
jgi:hypothetical protein